MTSLCSTGTLRAVWIGLLLTAICSGDDAPADRNARRLSPGAPRVRRIFVPAATPSNWPNGDWDPISWEELQRRLQQLRDDHPDTDLEQAEYRARLVRDSFEEGRLKWTARQVADSLRYQSLSPMNLGLGRLEWTGTEQSGTENSDTQQSRSSRPAVWGTGPDGTVGLLLEPSRSILTGTWSLAGRRLPRSLEFVVQLPAATVSRLLLELPAGLRLTSSAGEVSGPVRGADAAWESWTVDLGSRTECRLRVAPPGAETARRGLSISQSRTNYVVRPEVVRVLAEFEIEAFESSLREVRLQVDPGLQVVAVEHGDEAGVTWKAESRPEGDVVTVALADPISIPAQMLRVRGIAAIKPGEPWTLPRLRALDTVPGERLVTVRMQPPFQAADLRLEGYRQTELTAVPNEGETVVLRQIAEDASLVVVPAAPRIEAVCRSVAVVQFQREEWACAVQLDLQAAAGSTFEAGIEIPAGWEVIAVRGAGAVDGGDVVHWDVLPGPNGQTHLHVDFQAALDSTQPQRVRIVARHPGLDAGEWFAVPIFACRGEFSRDATTVFVSPEGERPVFRGLVGVELSDLSDLGPEQKGTEPLQRLTARQRERAVVVRSFSHAAAGQMTLRKLHSPERDDASGRSPPGTSPAATDSRSPDRSGPTLAAIAVAAVQLSTADSGFDRVQFQADLVGADGREVTVDLPTVAELVTVRIDGALIPLEADEGRVTIEVPTQPVVATARRLSIEYRLPRERTFGPNRARIGLPRLSFPVMQFKGTILVPSGLRANIADDTIEWTFDQSREAPPSRFGPLGRALSDEVFHPWRFSDWRRLWRRLASSEVASGGPLGDEQNRGPTADSAEIFASSLASGDAWRGQSLGMPASLDLDLWDRLELESLEWVLTLGALLAVLFARALLPQAWGRISLVAVFSLVTLAFSSPPWLSELGGSALTGLTLGTFVPKILLPGRIRPVRGGSDGVPGGSTQSFAHGALLLLLLLPWAITGYAQEPGGRPSIDGAAAAGSVDVLFPVGADGKPVGPDPVCYVPSGFLNDLARRRPGREIPAWLIAVEDVEQVVTATSEARITVRLEILVLSRSESVRVDIPLRNGVFAETDPCLVDGKPQPVLLGTGGRGVSVELPGLANAVPAEADLQARPDSPPEPEGGRPESPAARHLVAFQLRTLVEAEGSEILRSRISLPRVSDTRAVLRTDTPGVRWIGVKSLGIVPRQVAADSNASGDSVTLRGPADELEFRWSPERPTGPRATELDVSLSAMVDVFPNLIRSNWHLTGRVLSGSVDGLALTIPPGATLDSVQSPGMGGFVVESRADGRRNLILEYGTPQTGNLSAIVSLLQPLSALEANFPVLELAELPELPNRATLRRCQLGFRQPLDYRLLVSGANPELVVRPRTVDEFLKEWPMAGARPQQAIDLARPGALHLALQQLPDRLTARGDARGRFSAGLLEWTYSAEIDQPVVPPFQYRLAVDPRLIIRKATVQEDGAERLLRWSRVKDLLVLFLNDRAARGQTIRIEATMPVPATGDVLLPGIEVEGARNEGTRVSLYQEPGTSVSLVDDAPSDSLPETSPGPGQPRLIARYDQQAGTSPRQVHLSQAAPEVALESAFLVRPRGDQLEWTGNFEFRVLSARTGRFDLQLPRELAERQRFTTAPASQQLLEPASGGKAVLSFFTAEPVTDQFVVQVKVSLEHAAEGLTLPDVTSPGSRSGARWLVLPRNESVELPAAVIPDWLTRFVNESIDLSSMAAYRLPDAGPLPALHPARPGETSETAGGVADFRVEFHASGDATGQLLLWLPARTPDPLEFDWPAGATPSAALIDGEPVEVSAVDSGGWKLPLRDGAPKLVWLSWKLPHEAILSPIHSFQALLPRPRVPLATEVYEVSLGTRFVPAGADDLHSEQAIEMELARWEAALALSEARESRSFAMPYLRRVAKRAALAVDDAGNAVSALLHRQYDELDRRTQALERSKESHPESGLATGEALAESIAGPEARSTRARIFLRQLPLDEQAEGPLVSRSVWGIRHGFLMGTIGVAVGLALTLVLWKSGRLIAWIQDHESACWLALGAFWWLALRPSPLGVLIIAWGAWRIVRRTLGRRTEPESVGF